MENATIQIKKNYDKSVTISVKLEQGGKPLAFRFEKELRAGVSAAGLNFEKLDGKPILVEKADKEIIRILTKDKKVLYQQSAQLADSKISSKGKAVSTGLDSLAALRSQLPDRELVQPTNSLKSQERNPGQLPIDKLPLAKQAYDIPEGQSARAPYNFIPLNDLVVPAPQLENSNLPVSRNQFHSDRHTGWIELNLQTLSPLYIRGLLGESDLNEPEGSRQFSAFFAPDGKPAIPGSSIRGLTRQMVEIISHGKFVNFNSKQRLYYRGMADLSHKLRDDYKRRMSSEGDGGRGVYQAKAGILVKRGFSYYLRSTGYQRIFKDDIRTLVLGAKEHQIYPIEKSGQFLVMSGWMGNKKNQWLVDFASKDAAEILVLEQDIDDYRSDSNRNSINLLDWFKEDGFRDGVPVFYTEWTDAQNQKRISIGHTPMFRLGYEKSLGEHVPTRLQDSSIIDYAEAIFGRGETQAGAKDSIVGRVYFEDAAYSGDQQPEQILMDECSPKILSGPKATSFQHYLVQSSENLKGHPRNLANYNDNTPIRGYKQYWHQKRTDWKASPEDVRKSPTQYTTIRAVKENVNFTGKIRFENLSSEELGALLCALELPHGCAHKLGMGKSLGLGSVKIDIKLHLSDRKARYSNLFAEWNALPSFVETAQYQAIFAADVLQKLNKPNIENSVDALWRLPRLNELKSMLNLEQGRKLTASIETERKAENPKVRHTPVLSYKEKFEDKRRGDYMLIERKVMMENGDFAKERGRIKVHNEYKSRPVLPLPSQLVE